MVFAAFPRLALLVLGLGAARRQQAPSIGSLCVFYDLQARGGDVLLADMMQGNLENIVEAA